MAVRRGRNAHFVGHVPEKAKFVDLTSIPLETIFMKLCADDIAKMFILHPNFADAAALTFYNVCRNDPETPFNVSLGSTRQPKRLEEVRKALKHLGSFVLNLEITGYCNYEVTAADIELMQDIVKYCPNVRRLSLCRIYTDDLGMEYFTQFVHLSSVRLMFSRLGRRAIHLPNMTEFVTSILPLPNCRTCDEAFTNTTKHYDEPISHDNFIALWLQNPQLQIVELDVISYKHRLEPCMSKCNFKETHFFSEIKDIFARRNMEKFIVRIEGYPYRLMNRN